MSISPIHHVSLSVTDLDASAAFYIDVLGFQKTMEAPVVGQEGYLRLPQGTSGRMAMLQAPGQLNGSVELIQFALDGVATSPPKRPGDPGIWMIAFEVVDETLAQVAERLRAKGIVFWAEPRHVDLDGYPGFEVLLVEDPDGVLIELVELPGPYQVRAFRQRMRQAATNVANGAWQERTLADVVADHADRTPERLAVADQHERLSYRQLVTRARSLAAWLVGQGLAPGDVVALQSANRIALPLTHLACDIADLVFMPLSDTWRQTEVSHLLGTSGAVVAIVPSAADGFDHLGLVDELRSSLPDLRLVGTLAGGGGDFDFDQVSTGTATGGERPRDPDAPRFVMVSSGTTDVPTMSLWSDNNVWFFMRQYAQHVGLREDDVAVGLAPANTGATGYVFPVMAPLLHGASSVLLEHWSPQAALDLLSAERATLATAVPTQIIKLLQTDGVRTAGVDALRVFNNAGAPLPVEVAEELEQVFGCTVQSVYGATDGGVPVMTSVEDLPAKRYTTVGQVLPHTDVRLVDPLLADVEPGRVGEILWRGPTKSHGYFNAPERDAAVWLDDGYYRSGDLGQFDADGYLRIVGRAKDMIIRGGQNVSPREIEEVVVAHPAVAEVAVVGVPDEVYGERVCACVRLVPGERLGLDDLCAFLEGAAMAKSKWPERLEVFDELPTSAGAKVNKVALRRAVAER